MAIDPRISLAVNPPANASQTFSNVLTNIRNMDLIKNQREQAPLQNQLMRLEAELGEAQQPAKLQQAQRASSAEYAAFKDMEISDQIRMTAAKRIYPFLQVNDKESVISELDLAINSLDGKGVDQALIDPLVRARSLALQDGGFEKLKQATDYILRPQGQQTSVSQKEFDDNVSAVKADPELQTVEGRAASIALGLTPKASSTKDERAARDKELGSLIAQQKASESEASEAGKSRAQLKFKPEITKQVKLAEKAATERGEALTDLARMEASLPGVKEVVKELVELSSIATSTLGGRAFDFAVKESGFGSTKGADAKAKLIAIVDNQVLPLLKETFGAAFTVQEGENLKASLVDPDASPSQKRAQLEAFLAQKERNVRTKQAQLNRKPVTEGFKILSVE